MKKLTLLSLPFILSSCNPIESLGTVGIVIIFVVLLVAMGGMTLLVAKKKKNVENSATKFSHTVKQMIDNVEKPQDKIKSLDILVKRIKEDARYEKNPSWRDMMLSKVYQHKATVYFRMGDQKKIIEACTDVLGVEPSHMMSYYNRGTIYSNQGKYERAIEDLTSAISLDNQYASSYNNRGYAYGMKGEYEKAISDLDYAIFLEPTAASYFNRGNVYKTMKDLAKAKEDYQSALELEDENNLSGIKTHIEKAIELLNERED